MRKNMKKVATLLIASLLFVGYSCDNATNTPNEIEIFGAPITEKILQDVEASASQKKSAKFSIVGLCEDPSTPCGRSG